MALKCQTCRHGKVLRAPEGWECQISRHSLQESGRVVSHTHRLPLPPGIIRTGVDPKAISKRPFAVTKCSPWLVSKQSPRLLGPKLSYAEICYIVLPHLLPSSPYRQQHKYTRVTKPRSQYYGKSKQRCRNVWIWSFVWGVQLVVSEPQQSPGYYTIPSTAWCRLLKLAVLYPVVYRIKSHL
jgi:hypothetical protein